VYLADEKNHGTGFPSGIEETLVNVISSWPGHAVQVISNLVSVK
jgi:hypothetical protein